MIYVFERLWRWNRGGDNATEMSSEAGVILPFLSIRTGWESLPVLAQEKRGPDLAWAKSTLTEADRIEGKRKAKLQE